MNSEEIKQAYSMRDILARYGFVIDRKGYINCPFHKEKTNSMKIYKDSYNCFGCGRNGDIFTFVQEIENLTFEESFLLLGGTYEHSLRSQIMVYKSKKGRERQELQEIKTGAKISLNILLISVYRKWMDKSEPLSQTWVDCFNELQKQLRVHEIINEKRR